MSTIFYGTEHTKVNVTEIAIKNCVVDGTLSIPTDDRARAVLFECDPVPAFLKCVFIEHPDGSVDVYDQNHSIEIPDFA